jgi:transposase-like protein
VGARRASPCRWRREAELRQTDPPSAAEIDRLLDDYTDSEVAERLNAEGRRPGMGGMFHARLIARLRKDYGLPSRYERLRARGLLTQREMAERLGVDPTTVHHWRRQGRLIGYAYSDKQECRYARDAFRPS